MTSQIDTDLLLLHALPFDNTMWSEQMALLPNHTYAPNLYEFGNNIKVWAEKALALSKAKRLIVVGCSVGGSCALEIAKLAPDRISALVLIGTKAKHDPNPDFHKEALDVLKNLGVGAAWETYWEPLFAGESDKKVIAKAKSIASHQSVTHLMNGVSAFHTRPCCDTFVAQCNIPIHVVTGENDNLPGLAYCRKLAAAAKSGHLHIVPSSGHYVPLVRPKHLNALLSGIIEKHVDV